MLQAFLPLLGADRALTGSPGRIVMVSSVTGKLAAPFIGSYAASKHALEGMSESLRRELMLHGIDVIIVGAPPRLQHCTKWACSEDVLCARANRVVPQKHPKENIDAITPYWHCSHSGRHLWRSRQFA